MKKVEAVIKPFALEEIQETLTAPASIWRAPPDGRRGCRSVACEAWDSGPPTTPSSADGAAPPQIAPLPSCALE